MRSTNRRQFVKGTLAAAALAAPLLRAAESTQAATTEPRAAAASKQAPDKKPRLSVLSYSFRGLLEQGQMDLFGYLESCKYRFRLDAADIWTGFLPNTDAGFLKKVRDALDERELTLADLCVDTGPLWEDTPEARQRNREKILAHLKVAETLGARFMRVDAGGRDTSWSAEQFDYVVAQYREHAQWAWDHGFRMGAENHWGTEGIWANLQKLYRAVDHPGFGLSIHIGGWQGTPEEKAEADRQVAPWVCHTHFDWDTTHGPLEQKMANLRGVGYQGYYSVEHHSGKNEYAEVAIQLALVRSVFDRWRGGENA